jgi:hypothetical protein
VVPLVLVPEVEPTRPLGALPGVALGLIAGRAGHFPLSLHIVPVAAREAVETFHFRQF